MADIFLSKYSSEGSPSLTNKQKSATFIISKISFSGNDSSRPQIFFNEIKSREGKTSSISQLNKDKQSILNLSLFRSVEFEIKSSGIDNSVEVTFFIKEKHYWFVLPDASRNGDGDISYGLDFEFTNLFGLNQFLEFEIERTDFNAGNKDKEDAISLSYKYPKIFGTDYNIGFEMKSSTSGIDESRDSGLSGQYDRKVDEIGFNLSKWYKTNEYAQGILLGTGITFQKYDHEFLSGDSGLYFDADIIRNQFKVQLSDVEDHVNYRTGKQYGYGVDISSGKLGSDESYTNHEVFFKRYKSLNKRKLQNINYQFRIGYANATVFDEQAYDIGGSRYIRGYSKDKLQGNAYWLGNIEYLHKLFGKKAVRGVLFLDIGNSFSSLDDGAFNSANGGIGFGFRWKLRSFVKTDLRFDAAMGIGSNPDNKFYFGTRSTF